MQARGWADRGNDAVTPRCCVQRSMAGCLCRTRAPTRSGLIVGSTRPSYPKAGPRKAERLVPGPRDKALKTSKTPLLTRSVQAGDLELVTHGVAQSGLAAVGQRQRRAVGGM